MLFTNEQRKVHCKLGRLTDKMNFIWENMKSARNLLSKISFEGGKLSCNGWVKRCGTNRMAALAVMKSQAT